MVNNDTTLSILKAANLTSAERSNINNFKVGDVLRFNERESKQIPSNEYLKIKEINVEKYLIRLENTHSKEIIWQVPEFKKNRSSPIEVFKKETRDIQVGDLIRWSRTDKRVGLLSSEAATILNINDNNLTVELANKKQLIIDTNDPKFQHWDHGYAATVYAVQGKTKEIILAHLESFRPNLTTQSAFLVALTPFVYIPIIPRSC